MLCIARLSKYQNEKIKVSLHPSLMSGVENGFSRAGVHHVRIVRLDSVVKLICGHQSVVVLCMPQTFDFFLSNVFGAERFDGLGLWL